jgi:uncharacterized Fe-S center protein
LPDSRAQDIKPKEGWDIFSLIHKKDARFQIKEAERLGLGTSNYELITI